MSKVNTHAEHRITHARLLEVIQYDSRTGIFRNKDGRVVGHVHTDGYFKVGVDGRDFMAHRLAWFYVTGKWPWGEIDHHDHNKLNNSYGNLRPVTRGQNLQNMPFESRNCSGVIGVYPQGDKWRARIRFNGKLHHLGVYATKDEAIAARLEGEKKFFTHLRPLTLNGVKMKRPRPTL